MTLMNPKKAFDCVEMKRQAVTTLNETLETMTPEERLRFWQGGTQRLRKRQEELQRKTDEV